MRISIVTPSYNQAAFLEDALASVARQAHDDVEHAVFDGGSTDGSVAILERWSGRIQWKSERDGGQADAVNRGILATTGEIVGWLNSDDFYYPGAFDAVIAAFREDAQADVVYGRANHVDIGGATYEAYPTEEWSYPRLAETCFICQPALFFRRSVVAKAGLLNERLDYCMDYEYWMRLARVGCRFKYITGTLAASRMYGTNKTLGSRVKVHAEINSMLRAQLGATPVRWLFNYGHVVAEKRVDRQHHGIAFAAVMAITSVAAALRWNYRVTPAMGRRIAAWLLGLVKRGRQ